jgi:hypothetical protein
MGRATRQCPRSDFESAAVCRTGLALCLKVQIHAQSEKEAAHDGVSSKGVSFGGVQVVCIDREPERLALAKVWHVWGADRQISFQHGDAEGLAIHRWVKDIQDACIKVVLRPN